MTSATAADYHAIAAGLSFETRAFIDGHFVAARCGETMETANPATGEVLATVASCQTADIHRAVAFGPLAKSRFIHAFAGRLCRTIET